MSRPESDDTPLGRELGRAVRAFRFWLETALAEAVPDDAARGEVERLLSVLSAGDRLKREPVARDALGEALRTAWSGPYLQGLLGPPPAQVPTGQTLWQCLALRSLRLAPSDVRGVSEVVGRVVSAAGATLDARFVHKLPGPTQEGLFPGVRDLVPGLETSPEVPLDAMFARQRSGVDVPARVVACCLALLDLDPECCHALEDLERHGVHRLDDHQRSRYRAALVQCWERVRDESQDPETMWRDWVRLDEAVHSLVFDPPAAAGSWWARLQALSRGQLDAVAHRVRSAGVQVAWRLLRGPYMDVVKYSDRNTDPDIAPQARLATPRGEVVACLRVYSAIGGRELPGRVMYCPR